MTRVNCCSGSCRNLEVETAVLLKSSLSPSRVQEADSLRLCACVREYVRECALECVRECVREWGWKGAAKSRGQCAVVASSSRL